MKRRCYLRRNRQVIQTASSERRDEREKRKDDVSLLSPTLPLLLYLSAPLLLLYVSKSDILTVLWCSGFLSRDCENTAECNGNLRVDGFLDLRCFSTAAATTTTTSTTTVTLARVSFPLFSLLSLEKKRERAWCSGKCVITHAQLEKQLEKRRALLVGLFYLSCVRGRALFTLPVAPNKANI